MKNIRPRIQRALDKQKTEQGRYWREKVLAHPGRIMEAEVLLWGGKQKAKVFYHNDKPTFVVFFGSQAGHIIDLDGETPEEHFSNRVEYVRKAHTMTTSKTFQSLDQISNEMGERNDCVVKALCVAGNISYLRAHKILEDLGRRRRRGCPGYWLKIALKQLGFKLHEVDLRRFRKFSYGPYYKIPRTITTYHPTRFPKAWKAKGTYILWTRGHVAVVKDGVMHDWTVGRSHRVTSIDKVIA